MAVHAQPKYGGSPPWHSLSQAYVGEGFMGLAVGIEVLGAFVGFDVGTGAGVGLVIVGMDMGLEVYVRTVGLRTVARVVSWVAAGGGGLI